MGGWEEEGEEDEEGGEGKGGSLLGKKLSRWEVGGEIRNLTQRRRPTPHPRAWRDCGEVDGKAKNICRNGDRKGRP